jgi:hypothetical protein
MPIRRLSMIAFSHFILLVVTASAAPPTCDAPPQWFPPTNILTDPTASTNPTQNCDFHKWAWQEFLYLTTSVGGRPRFLDFPTDRDLLTPGTPPVAYDQIPIKPLVTLTPRINKSGDPKAFDDVFQAQSQGVALLDKSGRAVYYLVNVNPTYYNFVRTNHLYDPVTYAAASNTLNFPDGSVVIKSSWRIVPHNAPPTDAFSMLAKLSLVTLANGKVTISPLTRVERVALVGIHIVGVVQHHPEFVWSTFEHQNNAPELTGTDPTSPDPVSASNFTFYTAGTAARDCNKSNAHVLTFLDPNDIDGQRLKPLINVFRQFKQGGGNDDNRNNISALNGSVHTRLQATDPSSKWLHYDLIGSVWTTGNLVPDQFITVQDSIGSIRMSNTTMETTTQDQGNCFSCHDTRHVKQQGITLGGKNLNISHILRDNFIQSSELLRH